MRSQMLFDAVGHKQRLVLGVVARVKTQQVPRARLGPELLSLARFVVLHHRAGGRQNVLGRTVILFEADGVSLRKVALEVQNVADIRAAPAIDRLILVADYTE